MKGENILVEDINNIYYFVVTYFMDKKTCWNISKNLSWGTQEKLEEHLQNLQENFKKNIHNGFYPEA